MARQDLVRWSRGETLLHLDVLHEELVRPWPEHVHFSTRGSLRSLTRRAGLEVIAIGELSPPSDGKPARLLQVACRRIPS